MAEKPAMWPCPSARPILHPKYGSVVATYFPPGTYLSEDVFKSIIEESDRIPGDHPHLWFVTGKLWMKLSQAMAPDGELVWPDPFLVPEYPDADVRPPPVGAYESSQPEEPPDFGGGRTDPVTPSSTGADKDYALMGLSIDADMDVVKAAYRVLCLKWHPDKGGSHEKMTELNEAYTRIQAKRQKKGGSQ